MSNSELDPFAGFRRNTIVTGVLLVVVAIGSLFVVEALSPDAGIICSQTTSGTTTEGGFAPFACEPASAFLSSDWANVLTTVAGTALAVGIVTLVVEFSLRKSFGLDLLRFLRLEAAVVQSGLDVLGPSTHVSLHDEILTMDEVIYLGRSPSSWLNEYLPALLRVAEKRKLKMTLALPNPNNPEVVQFCSQSLGVDPDDLVEAVNAFVTSAQTQWKSALPTLTKGSGIRLVLVDQAPLYDVLVANNLVATFQSKPTNQADDDDLQALVYKDQRKQFPSSWLEASVASLSNANETFIGMKT